MYLNEKKIKLLKTKNILFICFGVFEAFFSGSYIVSEFVMYRDNLYTAWHAKSMASSILFFTVGSILLVHALISRHRIGQATFFSSYFPGTCPHCKSCDLFAKILTDQRFYSISSDVEKGNQDASFYLSGGRKIEKVRKAIHKGDLINCTLEVHQKELVVALAKKIVKDKCPSCSGPIVGAVDGNYVCNYCGKQIMGFVEKG